jgi:hypothetical protein
VIETSDDIKHIAIALMEFQGMTDGVFRGSNNPHFRSKYANLETVIDTARPALQKAGIAFTQTAGMITDGNMEMTTMLIHAQTGQWIKSTMQIPLGKRDPQGAGSAQTYAQRYSLMAILGLPPTDDDAEAAIDRDHTRPAPDEPPVKSSAQLKRDGAWETISGELQNDLIDCHSLIGLEKLKDTYRSKVAGWTPAWKNSLKDMFDAHEDKLIRQREAEEAADHVMHPLMAGE